MISSIPKKYFEIDGKNFTKKQAYRHALFKKIQDYSKSLTDVKNGDYFSIKIGKIPFKKVKKLPEHMKKKELNSKTGKDTTTI